MTLGEGSTVLEMWAFSQERIQFLQDLLQTEEWTSAHPDVQVNVRVFPYAQMHDRLLASLVSGQGAPDIAEVEISRFSQFITGERVPFVPLNDRIEPELENVYRPAATDPWTWEDQIYGVGNELNTCLVAYRQDIMDEAGVTTPFETWDDFIAAGQQISNEERKMVPIHDISFGDWYILAQVAGTTFFDEQGNCIANNEMGVEVMQFHRDLVHEHGVGGIAPADASNAWYGPQYWAAVRAGQFACIWGPPWTVGLLPQEAPDLSGQWRVQPFPSGLGESNPTANYGGTGQCITEQSQNVDIAWDLIRMANLTTQGVLADFRIRNAFPAYIPAYEEEAFNEPNEYFGGVVIGEIYSQVAPELVPFRQSPVWGPATEALIREGITPVMQNQKEPQQGMDDTCAEVERLQS